MRLLLFMTIYGFSVATWAQTYWIDVRTEGEFNQAHVAGAINIPFQHIVSQAKQRGILPEDTLYLYCRSGRRASFALHQLKQQGYLHVTNLETLAQAQAFKQGLNH